MMKNWYALLIFVAVLFPAGIVQAQDETPAEEFLRWLPDIPYMLLMFDNDEALRATKQYELVRTKLLYRVSGAPERLLPPAVAKTVLWYGLANTIRMRLSPGKDDPGGESRLPNNINANNMGERLLVARCDALADAVAAALENGELVKTDEKIGGEPVFTYQGETRDGRRDRFGCADPGGYFISANSLELLRDMAAAQRGELATVLESPDYAELQELLPAELADCQNWMTSMMKMMQRVNEEVFRRSVDATDQQLEDYREQQQQGPTMMMVSFSVSDTVIEERTIHSFADAETAEKMAPMFSETPGLPQDFAEYKRLKDQAMKTEVRDKFVISRALYDEEIIMAFKSAVDKLQGPPETPESKDKNQSHKK